jgi:hypothetical protein
MPIYCRERIYDVDPGLRASDSLFPKEPFSRSYVKLPIKELVGAMKLLHDSLIHEREYTGITDEDIGFIRALESKMKTLLEDDRRHRAQQDIVLRCLHPDGIYHAYLKGPEFDRAYEIAGSKRIDGIGGIRMGWPRAEVHDLAEYLKTVIARIKREYPNGDL